MGTPYSSGAPPGASPLPGFVPMLRRTTTAYTATSSFTYLPLKEHSGAGSIRLRLSPLHSVTPPALPPCGHRAAPL